MAMVAERRWGLITHVSADAADGGRSSVVVAGLRDDELGFMNVAAAGSAALSVQVSGLPG
jgi:hypothetical protein